MVESCPSFFGLSRGFVFSALWRRRNGTGTATATVCTSFFAAWHSFGPFFYGHIPTPNYLEPPRRYKKGGGRQRHWQIGKQFGNLLYSREGEAEEPELSPYNATFRLWRTFCKTRSALNSGNRGNGKKYGQYIRRKIKGKLDDP